ncbi:phospholipase carboxylesterase [Liquorilactobacillus aquaticus DSM 21051]|uniref:Phospholipase carboxylesterase n=1 Tax=Liquorilactobacillus aquaticus DSM 21051 TaxID=1423725 RepID=A0A0R2D4E6_9LACO|nr:hypothetical protein [Liquorilactobacillus aquaticus]KRM96788.1 phospholipase carboxylesterase [Liquorilactobacillus aquaticus DSM 21051]
MKYQYELLYPKAKVTSKTPVVITMHGMGSNFYDLRPLLEFFDIPVIQLHLQGDILFSNGFAFFDPDFSQQTEDEVIGPVITAVYREINAILGEQGLEAQPKLVLGFSQGAILTASLSVVYPRWMSGGIILSGRLPTFIEKTISDNNSEKRPPIFISQGKKDPLFAPQIGQNLAKFMQEHGYDVTYREYLIGHGVHPKAISDLRDWTKGKVW